MSLNIEDISKVTYKARLNWYKERFTAISAGEKIEPSKEELDFVNQKSTPDELIKILEDISKKASKLNKRIDFMSKGMQIPVDPAKQPDLSAILADLDPNSKGEYISYDLYSKLLLQRELAIDNIRIEDLIENATGDYVADSLLINSRLVEGLAKYTEIKASTVPPDNALERYSNRYLNNIFSWNEHDYKTRQIINFADNYLGMFPDPAYIPWSLKEDVSLEIKSTRNLSDLWKNFSTYFEYRANRVVGGIENITALDPDKASDSHDLTKRTIYYANNFLNGIDEVFNMSYGADLICCFVRWSGGLDMKTLKGLRALLQLFQTGLTFEFIDILNSLKDIVNNIFRGLLCDQLIGLITQITQRLVDPIKKWINNPDPRWQKIFTCTPVDEFINTYIVNTIEFIESLLKNLVKNWYKQIELDYTRKELKKDKAKEQMKIGEFIKILDLVIAALERSAICGTESSPTGEEIQRLMNAYSLGPGKEYKYPEEETPNIYNSFTPKDTQEDKVLGGKMTTKFDTATQTSGIGLKIMKIDECLKKVAPDDVVKIAEWT